jgi:sec-independent protein translocase protein TatB
LDSVKKAATDFTKYAPDSETGKLAQERAEAAEKINKAAAKRASDRIAAERAAEVEAKAAAEAAAKPEEPAKDIK